MKKTLLIFMFGMIFLVSNLTFAKACCLGDINLDGHVDDSDLSLIIANWGRDITWDPIYSLYNWPSHFIGDDALSFVLAHWGDKC